MKCKCCQLNTTTPVQCPSCYQDKYCSKQCQVSCWEISHYYTCRQDKFTAKNGGGGREGIKTFNIDDYDITGAKEH